MPAGPSARMKTLAALRLVDTVTVASLTQLVPTRAQMAAGAATVGTGVAYRAAVQTTSLTDEAGTNVDRVVRDLTVWVEDAAGVINAGDRCTFTATRDASLTGQVGTVLTVTRDSLQAVRRLTVRLGNDA